MSHTIALERGYTAEVGNEAAGRWWWILRGPNGIPTIIGDTRTTRPRAERAARCALSRLLAQTRAA